MQKAKTLPLTADPGTARKSPQLLETAERVALAGSWLALGAALLSKELISVGVPLTLVASLNWVNRKRLQQQLLQERRGDIAQIQDRLDAQPDPLDIQAVTQRLVKLEQSDSATIAQIEALKQQVRVRFKAEQLDVLKEAIARLRSDLTALQTQAIQKQELEDRWTTQLGQLYKQLEQLSNNRSPEEVRRVENAIALLHRDLSMVKEQISPLEREKWQRLQGRLAQVQAQLKQLENSVVPVRRKQRAMVQHLLPRMIERINENRPTGSPAPVQKVVPHRPPPPSLIHHSVGNSRNVQPIRQPQRQRDGL